MTYFRTLIFLLILSTLNSCGKDDPETPALSASKAITHFSVTGVNATISVASKTILLLISDTDVTALVPSISVSAKATINPASGVANDFSAPVTYSVTAEDGSTVDYQVSVQSSVVPFTYDGINYELIKENRSWTSSASIAVSRGGFLAEINDLAEQNALYAELGNAPIIASHTVAPDGGGASYVWIGGNDIATEGEWFWDGNNDQTGDQFWMGLQSGNPVGGLYNNWGNEPDNYGSGQDGLGLAITDWPLGIAGQWNDVGDSNTLFFLIEYD